MWATPDVARAGPTSARRRRERRIRSFFRHEQMAIKLAVESAQHHSAQRCCSVATQTEDEVLATTYAATASPVVACAATAASPLVEYVDPVPFVSYAATAPVIEYVAPAPVFEYIPPAPALCTGVNLDVTGLVCPLFPGTAVESSASQVVGSLPPCEVFAAPVFDQVHQEHLAGGEIPQNLVEIPVIPEQVIVQAFSRVAHSLPPDEDFPQSVFSPVHHEQFPAGEVMENFAEIPVHEQVVVQDIPVVVVPLPPAQEFSAPVYGHVHQVFTGMRPERLVDARRPQRCGRTPPSEGAPVLAVQSLRGFDGVDNTAAKFLLRQTLKKKKEEEEEDKKVKEALAAWTARRKAVTDEMHALLDISPLTPAQRRREVWLIRELDVIDAAKPPSLPKRRKRKKKRKKKTPKTSSSRAIRAQNSGHSSTSSSWIVFSGGVMSLVACGSSVLGMYWLLQHSAHSVLDCAYSWSYGVFMLLVQFSDKVVDVFHSPFEWLNHRYHCNCRDIVLFVGRLPRCESVCVAMSCGGGFTPGGAYDSVCDSVKPMTGNYFFYYLQYQVFVVCVCMLNYWFSSNDEICPDNYNFSRFKLKDKCLSETWELYLCGVMTIKVDRDSVEVLPRGVPPPRFFTQLGNGSHTIYELCLPSERGMV